MTQRVGIGYDAHRLVEERKLTLGGVTIPFERGLAGHSDADVLIHAIIDALLGAAGLGDIGRLFPDTDQQYKDISSVTLLEKTSEILDNKSWRICNIDATIVAQRPKLSPFITEMQNILGAALSIESSSVNIKAKTTENMGFTGREEGIEAYAVALLEKT